MGRSFCHNRLENYKEALSDLQSIVNLDSTYASALGNLGWQYYCLGDYENCIIYSKKAINLKGDSDYAKFNNAHSMLSLGLIQEAKEQYETLMQDEKIPSKTKKGAIKDLDDLVEKDLMKKEAQDIINKYTGI